MLELHQREWVGAREIRVKAAGSCGRGRTVPVLGGGSDTECGVDGERGPEGFADP